MKKKEQFFPDSATLLLGEIRGILYAFERINSKADNGCTYSCEIIPKVGTLQETLEAHFRPLSNSVGLERLENGKKVLAERLERWLFAYQPEVGYSPFLVDEHRSFSLSYPKWRQALIDEVMSKITKITNTSLVWQFTINPLSWYEAWWEDFSLESADKVFLLHFGVSD